MKKLLFLLFLICCPLARADFNTGDAFGKGIVIQNNDTTITGGGRTLDFKSGVTVTANRNVFEVTAVGVGTYSICTTSGNCPSSGGGGSAAGGLNAVQYNSPVGTFAGTENKFSFNGTNVGIGTSNATGGSLIVSTGNVGIGSLSPGALLDVKGSTNFPARITGSAGANGGLILGSYDANNGGIWSTKISPTTTNYSFLGDGSFAYVNGGSSGGAYLMVGDSPRWFVQGSTGHFLDATDNTYDIGASGANRPRNIYVGTNAIVSGNVGIGSLAPGTALDVAGLSRFGTSFEATNTTSPKIAAFGAGPSYIIARDSTNNIELQLGADTDRAYVGTITNHNLDFEINGSSKWHINTSGALGGAVDNSYDIGDTATTFRPRTGYFGTSLVSPILAGGSSTTQTLTLQPTTGAGTTGSDLILSAGNNGATQGIRVLASGNIGIGTYPAPTDVVDGIAKFVIVKSNTGTFSVNSATTSANIAPFEVLGNTTGAAEIYFNNGNNTIWRHYFHGASTAGTTAGITNAKLAAIICGGAASGPNNCMFGATNDVPLIFVTNNANVMYAKAGNVGIGGLTSLKNVLDVNGSMAVGGYSGSYTAPSNGAIIQGNVGIGTQGPSTLFEVGTQKFNVLSGGNVGIGSISPGAALDIQGRLRQSTAPTLCSAGNYPLGVDGSLNAVSCTAAGGGSSFWVAGNVGINTTSNVGIGTVNPGQALDVNGGIRSTAAGSSTFSGNVGIGSASPGSGLDVGSTKIRLTTNSHLVSTAATAPTVANNDCGSTSQGTIVAKSSDVSGTVTVGTLNVTSCAVTFASAWTVAPNCVVVDDTSILTVKPSSVTTTKLTIASTTSMSSDNVTWICIGNE